MIEFNQYSLDDETKDHQTEPTKMSPLMQYESIVEPRKPLVPKPNSSFEPLEPVHRNTEPRLDHGLLSLDHFLK